MYLASDTLPTATAFVPCNLCPSNSSHDVNTSAVPFNDEMRTHDNKLCCAEFCPGVTGSTDNSDEAIRESATTERIIHFLEEELHKFEGFQLLGKAEQKTQSTRDSVTSRPQQGSTQLSSRCVPSAFRWLQCTASNLFLSCSLNLATTYGGPETLLPSTIGGPQGGKIAFVPPSRLALYVLCSGLILHCRKCSIVRLDRHGNKYIGACTPADMHTVHSSKEHHGSAPTVRSDKSSLGSSSVKEESFFPEESSSFSQDRSENSTSSHHTSSDTPQLHTPLKHTTSQHARPNLISRVKDLFHLSGGSQTSTHSQTNSHTPAQKKVPALHAIYCWLQTPRSLSSRTMQAAG